MSNRSDEDDERDYNEYERQRAYEREQEKRREEKLFTVKAICPDCRRSRMIMMKGWQKPYNGMKRLCRKCGKKLVSINAICPKCNKRHSAEKKAKDHPVDGAKVNCQECNKKWFRYRFLPGLTAILVGQGLILYFLFPKIVSMSVWKLVIFAFGPVCLFIALVAFNQEMTKALQQH